MNQDLSQKLRQELRLSPQLLELVKILQLPRLELQQMIRQEIEINPFLADETILEEDEEYSDSLSEEPVKEDEGNLPNEHEIDYDYFYHDEWKSTGYDFSRRSSEDEDFNPVDVYSTPKSLREHMLFQVHMNFDDPVEIAVAEFITDSLDDEGILNPAKLNTSEEKVKIAEALSIPLDELPDEGGCIDMLYVTAAELSVPLSLVEGVLKKYRFLEPVGVGSRNVRESLMTQLEFRGMEDSTEYAIIRDSYDDLMSNRIYKIVLKLKMTEAKVNRAIDEIRKLSPKPANGEWGRVSDYIIPDVIIERKGDELISYLNTTNFPELHLNRRYLELLQSGKYKGKKDEKFLKQRLNSAVFMIEGIYKRNTTLMKITERIIAIQRDFFDEGVSALKPMILTDVSEEIGMHESTVCRAIENKYVDTPIGMYPFKFFFSRSIKTDNGEMSATNVKDMVKTMIETEDPSSPLRDNEIAEQLEKNNGIKLARRTVAKYREQLGFLTAAKRKRYSKEV